MKLAYGILGLGLALLALAGLGVASATIGITGLVSTILGAFVLAIVLEEQDLASSPTMREATVEVSEPQRAAAA